MATVQGVKATVGRCVAYKCSYALDA